MTKQERLPFFIGVIGVALLLAVTLTTPCLTPRQGFYLSIALGLMAALVARQIPGALNIDLSPAAFTKVRAGGAIAVFIIIVFAQPLTVVGYDSEERFANTICQGKVPEGKQLDEAKLPPSLNPYEAGPISTDDAMGRLVKFSFYYSFGELAGDREWSQVKPGVWIEAYPNNKLFTAFREVGRMTNFGCSGSVVERQDSSGFKVFIPDKDCEKKWLWFQVGGGPWSFLGSMNSYN
ncbi:hypothetical protein D9M70_255600 [compost metagenome]